MSKLSVVLATYNEEENIARCLDSVEGIADEIVIVDGSSHDKTVEIAKKYNARIEIVPNHPNFHINKQKAIDMARSSWILQLDADEVVTSELGSEVKSKIQDPNSKYDGYWMPRKNYFLGRFLVKGGQYPDYTIRLYRKGKGRLPQKDVHEQAVVEGKVGYLVHPLLHYPYKNFSVYIEKWNRYNNLRASQLAHELKHISILQHVWIACGFLFFRPAHWFLTTYIRHKGFMDAWQGFVFSLFSALRFPTTYFIYMTQYGKKNQTRYN